MSIIRYGKTGLLGQTPTYYTPTYTPTYTPPPPTYTPMYTPPPAYTPTYTPPPAYTPTYTPPPPIYMPIYQGTPSYVPPPVGTPTEINPEEAGLQPEGTGPSNLIYYSGGGGAFGPSGPVEELPVEELPVEESKKTNWLLWLAVAFGAYLLLGGDIL